MNAAPPLPCLWDGESFTPANPHWARTADRFFIVGQVYPLEIREDRSSKSHRHYFAAIKEAWSNLPEPVAEMLPSPEHLRKYALIRTGYRDERSIVCASRTEAERVAAFVRPLDEFSVVGTKGAVVAVWTAKSQSLGSMARREFQESKTAVLDFVAAMIGTSTDALRRAAEAA